MKKTWIIVYKVSERGGHGEGSIEHDAVWVEAGAFESEQGARAFIGSREAPYGVYDPKPMEMQVR